MPTAIRMRGLICAPWEVRSILTGEKTRARRAESCTLRVGDLLYVRETWAREGPCGPILYRAGTGVLEIHRPGPMSSNVAGARSVTGCPGMQKSRPLGRVHNSKELCTPPPEGVKPRRWRPGATMPCRFARLWLLVRRRLWLPLGELADEDAQREGFYSGAACRAYWSARGGSSWGVVLEFQRHMLQVPPQQLELF